VGGHAEIHQAAAMVLARLATDALARPRVHAFTHQRPPLDVSADVVARRLTYTEEMR
jgi:hypothetical protein